MLGGGNEHPLPVQFSGQPSAAFPGSFVDISPIKQPQVITDSAEADANLVF